MHLTTFRRFFVLAVLVMAGFSSFGQGRALAAQTDCNDNELVRLINRKASDSASLGGVRQGPFATSGRDGCYTDFDNGSIYVSERTNASVISGTILDKWLSLDGESSALGYPRGDTIDLGDGWANTFEDGVIMWKASGNEAFAVYGDIGRLYAQWDYQASQFGYPISDTDNWWSDEAVGGQAQATWFEHGIILQYPKAAYDDSSAQPRLVALPDFIYRCWRQEYTASDNKSYRFPVSARLEAGSSEAGYRYWEISFIANQGRVLEVSGEDDSDTIDQCVSHQNGFEDDLYSLIQ